MFLFCTSNFSDDTLSELQRPISQFSGKHSRGYDEFIRGVPEFTAENAKGARGHRSLNKLAYIQHVDSEAALPRYDQLERRISAAMMC